MVTENQETPERSKVSSEKAERQEAIKRRRAVSKDEDGRLIKKALKGDQASFRTLMKKYSPAVTHILMRMIHRKDEVEDLTQETFIKAFVSLSSFNNEYSFSTWLLKIAQNHCIDYIRKRKLPTLSIDKPIESKDGEISMDLRDDEIEPDERLIQSQRAQMIEKAIASLPPKYRTVITMRHTEEKDYQEIADELDLPIGTIKAHIFRAREMLNKALRKKLSQY